MKIFGIEFETLGRKPGQQASSQRENYLSFILDRVPVGIMQTGLDGRYVYVNSHFCKLTGRSYEELVGLHFESITHPDDVFENARLFSIAVDTGAPYSIRKRYLRPDGTAVWTEVSVTVLSERHEGLLSVCVDLTDRMRAEAQKNILIQELNLTESESRGPSPIRISYGARFRHRQRGLIWISERQRAVNRDLRRMSRDL